jgi:hypothetical protein
VREDFAEAQKSKNPLGIPREKLRRNSVMENAGENSGIGAHREERQRSRPLGTWSFSKCRKKVCKLRRKHNSRQIDERKRSGPLVSTSREQQEDCTGRTDLRR